MAEIWLVVGGSDRGGIIVREGVALSSIQALQRLATGARVRERELMGERLSYELLEGSGPSKGWVTVRVGVKELLVRERQEALAPPKQAPFAAQTVPLPQTKQVWCVRHGEAEHNVLIDRGEQGSELRDPPLSALGFQQAREVAEDPLVRDSAFGPPQLRAELIVSSPCTRALQTATEARRASASRDPSMAPIPLLALPDLQECTDNPCDTGRRLQALVKEFPGVDFSELASQPDTWFTKLGSNRGDEGRQALRDRCARVTAWLAGRREQRIVVVAHRTFFCYMLQLDFAPAEVIEMKLQPNMEDGLRAPTWTWLAERASDAIFPLYNWKDEPLCSQGSPPLRGTLATCLSNRGDEAARNTARRAGLPWQIWCV